MAWARRLLGLAFPLLLAGASRVRTRAPLDDDGTCRRLLRVHVPSLRVEPNFIEVRVVGASAELGGWNLNGAWPMTRASEAELVFEADVQAPSGTEFKYVMLGDDGNVRWELSRGNRWFCEGPEDAEHHFDEKEIFEQEIFEQTALTLSVPSGMIKPPFDDKVAVVGASAELGNWKPIVAPRMQLAGKTRDAVEFTMHTASPPGTEFKFVLHPDGGAQFESGPNRVLESTPIQYHTFRTPDEPMPRRHGSGVVETRPAGVFVMMPLTVVTNRGWVKNSWSLARKLNRLVEAKVDGFMLDVWWGLTEKTERKYDFRAYHKIMKMAERRGLKVQVVASFHQCGGNVGDDCNIPLPDFVTRHRGIWYRGQDDDEPDNKEYISLFADDKKLGKGENRRTPLEMYGDWFVAFAESFREYLGTTIVEVQVGMGPAGELRYPSYSLANGWRFCGIGEFQAWDPHALRSLAEAGKSKHLSFYEPLEPPLTAGSKNSEPDETEFFRSGYRDAYGKFFLDWYFGALKNHGARVLEKAAEAFGGQVQLSGKVSGIHWWYGHHSHAAEVTAGYYNTNGRDAYAEIAEIFKAYGASVCFTCLEMRNHEQPAECLSRPQELVAHVRDAAASKGAIFNGENALPRYDRLAYDTILGLQSSLHIFTYLRLNDDLLKRNNFKEFSRFVRIMQGRKEEPAKWLIRRIFGCFFGRCFGR